jgi:hypothetical protein
MIGVITVLVMSQAAATAEPQQIDLDVPSTTVAATVQINVKPSKGAVLLYTGPSYDKPIRFPGPSSTRVLPTSSRTVRIELVEGAKSFRVLMASMDRKSNLRRDDPSSCLMSDGWSMSALAGFADSGRTSRQVRECQLRTHASQQTTSGVVVP